MSSAKALSPAGGSTTGDGVRSMPGYEAVPWLLHRHGVGVVFSMLGNTNAPWIAAGVREGLLRLVRTRHEETAVNAAVGHARATGALGVCSVTRGPGFANTVNALTAAVRSHIPILLVVAESPVTAGWSEQELDQEGLCRVLGAGFHHVADGEHLPAILDAAALAAVTQHTPQVLSVADRVLDDPVTVDDRPPDRVEPAEPDPAAVSAAVDALAAADRPLVLAGQGAVLAGAGKDLERLAEVSGARLATTLRANRMFSGHPSDLGLCGTWSPPIVRDEIAGCDVVLAVGASLNPHTTDHRQIFAGATVIQCEVDEDAPFRASSPQLGVVGDAGVTAVRLYEEWERRGLGQRRRTGEVPGRDRVVASVLDVDVGHDPARGLDVRDVYAAFDRKLPADRIVVNDSGRAMGAMATLVDAADARSWLVGRGYGSVGLGLGTAIGAAVAHPSRTVALFVGDGGLMMAAQDLDAVRLAGLDLLVVILNDEQYGAELASLTQRGLDADVVRQSMPDVPTLARAFGGVGYVLRTRAQLEAFELPSGGLTLVDARIDPQVGGADALG